MNRIENIDLTNKTVILRCDFNVPIKDNIIEDSTRIEKSLKTINYLLDKNCKIIILSHLGRIEKESDKQSNSLLPVANKLSKLLNKQIIFINACCGQEIYNIVKEKPLGSIILLENTRFMDIPNKLESNNNQELSKYWASLGNIYINDAFGVCHRAHASTAGIANYLPSAIGFLVEEELDNLNKLVNVQEHPYTIFMGGAKIEDKLPLIESILPKCDYLLTGGGIANSFLKAKGIDVKDSLATNNLELLNKIKELLITYKDKIVLPEDYVIDDNKILDIGLNTINKYNKYIMNSKLVFINGTPGLFEQEKYSTGTSEIFKALKNSNATVIVGGGDTLNASQKLGYDKCFSFYSSGGGATLEYIASGTLKAFEAMK
jgi:phosphoglycerate kinase